LLADPLVEAKPEQYLSAEQQAYATLLSHVEAELKKDSGAILLRTEKYMNGIPISIWSESGLKQRDIYDYIFEEAPITVYSELHTVNGYAIYGVVVNDLMPGNYFVGRPDTPGFASDRQDSFSKVTVKAGHVSEIDWCWKIATS
jgi:hypothetical protein